MRFREFGSSNTEGFNEKKEIDDEIEYKKRVLESIRSKDRIFGTYSGSEIFELKNEIFDLETKKENLDKVIPIEKIETGYNKKLSAKDLAHKLMDTRLSEKLEIEEKTVDNTKHSSGIDTDWIVKNETKEIEDLFYDKDDDNQSTITIDDDEIDSDYEKIDYDKINIEIEDLFSDENLKPPLEITESKTGTKDLAELIKEGEAEIAEINRMIEEMERRKAMGDMFQEPKPTAFEEFQGIRK